MPDTPLSERLLRLACWFDAIRSGSHEFSADGMAAFSADLRAHVEAAARLETDVTEARAAAFAAAARRILAQMPAGAVVTAPTSEHLTRLVAIARGEVPGVVLLPRRQPRATPWGCSRFERSDSDSDGGDAA